MVYATKAIACLSVTWPTQAPREKNNFHLCRYTQPVESNYPFQHVQLFSKWCTLKLHGSRGLTLNTCTYVWCDNRFCRFHLVRSAAFGPCELLSIRYFHISHNAPYLPPQILHNFCFSFLLGIKAVASETENNTYAKFWGTNKVHYGKCGNGIYFLQFFSK